MGTPPEQRRPRELALFAGIGGGVLGGQLLGWQTACYVERDPFCQQVLEQRIRDGWLDDAPIWDDVRTFNGVPWRGEIDVLTAGFPCQPFSVAGDKRGGEDHRNLWPATARVIREVRPKAILLENVANVVTGRHGYWGKILGDLADLGFDVVWDCVRADQCGAPHERRRTWALGVWRWREVVHWGECESFVPGGERRRCRVCGESYVRCPCPGPSEEGVEYRQFDGKEYGRRTVAHPHSQRREKFNTPAIANGVGSHTGQASSYGAPSRFRDESRPVGVADGISDRVDRLKSLGNAQVPHQMALAWTLLSRRLRKILGEASGGQ